MAKVGTYQIGEYQIRLCTKHYEARIEKGEDIFVPLIDNLAYIHAATNRPLHPRPCQDCKNEKV